MSVIDDLNAKDFTGHPRATQDGALWLSYFDTMIFIYGYERYLWVGARALSVGAQGSHVAVETDLLYLGSIKHQDMVGGGDGPDSNPHETMRWRGRHQNFGVYSRHDVVTDSGYLMIANKDTEDKPAPYPIGEPYDVRSLPGAPPAWTNESATSTSLVVGQRFTFSEAGFVRQAQFYIPSGNVGAKAEMWAVTDPMGAPDYQILIPEFTIDDDDDDAWINLPVGAFLVVPNTTFDIVLVIRSQTGEVTWSGNWNAVRQNGAPIAGQARHQSGSSGTRIHHTDEADGDRQVELEALNPGDEYEAAGTRYTIQSMDRLANDVRFYHDPTTRPQNGTYTYTFYTYGAVPIPYVRVPNWYQTFPGVSGFVSTDGYDPSDIVLTNDLMGVDIQVQQGYFSDDWDILSMPR